MPLEIQQGIALQIQFIGRSPKHLDQCLIELPPVFGTVVGDVGGDGRCGEEHESDEEQNTARAKVPAGDSTEAAKTDEGECHQHDPSDGFNGA